MADETSIGGAESRFQSTYWETVLRAKDGHPDALEQLLAEYWKPVYFFIRRKGHDVEGAKDLTQGFLGVFLEKDYLKSVSPERGRFRSFVMASLQHYLSDVRDRARAVKRGGRFNFVEAESDLSCAAPSPEKAFFKGWALTVLERAIEKLKKEVPPEDMDLLSGRFPEGMSVSVRKNRLHRLRAKLKEHLRNSILPNVEREAEVDSEIREILALLSG
jgi:RNA polymerase sigma-70 factor (ECF subfamily)